VSDVPFAAEQPLYDLLDAHGIPFRSPMADLLATHSSYESRWARGVTVCEIADAKPVIDGLVGPVKFTWNERSSISRAAWPQVFRSYVRRSADARANFSWAEERLVRLFGDGEDTSLVTTKARRWQFGEATVTASAFPADLKDPKMTGSNNRHKKIKGSATECAIRITPMWAPLPTPEEHVAIETYVPVWPLPVRHMPAWGTAATTLTSRWYPAAANELAVGVGFDPATRFLVKVMSHRPERVSIAPVAQIATVQCDHILPAKGSGGSRLYVEITQPDVGPERLDVASGDKPGDLNDLAAELGQRLGVPVNTNEYQDY